MTHRTMPSAPQSAIALDDTVRLLAEHLTAQGWMMATAESCTGGMIAAACTDLAGSSAWFDRGFVTYSNQAKVDMLGVDEHLIAAHGAVSEAVARAMAEGAVRHSSADVAVAVTGIAGPSGGTPDKPVGTVWLAWASRHSSTQTLLCHVDGDRDAVRRRTCAQALQGILRVITP
jgi:nicotinamide-nucleotide amidase